MKDCKKENNKSMITVGEQNLLFFNNLHIMETEKEIKTEREKKRKRTRIQIRKTQTTNSMYQKYIKLCAY